MKKVVFFNKSIISGGIEKCIEILASQLYKNYEIYVYYFDETPNDPNVINLISRYAKVQKIEDDMSVDCDVCVWCFLYFDYNKYKKLIHAKKYISWIHSIPRILPDCVLDNADFVNDCSEFVCVSEAVKNHLDIFKEGIVIHNFINSDIEELSKEPCPLEEIPSNILKLCVVSRISSGKGFERLFLLVKKLEEKNCPYILNIVGKGRAKEQEYRNLFKDFSNVNFVGYRDNPYNYIKNSDYLIQLSDFESWCNSITEAKVLDTPVIVTNFESASEQIIDGFNGIIVDLNENNYEDTIERMYKLKDILKENLKSFKYEIEIEKWNKLLG